MGSITRLLKYIDNLNAQNGQFNQVVLEQIRQAIARSVASHDDELTNKADRLRLMYSDVSVACLRIREAGYIDINSTSAALRTIQHYSDSPFTESLLPCLQAFYDELLAITEEVKADSTLPSTRLLEELFTQQADTLYKMEKDFASEFAKNGFPSDYNPHFVARAIQRAKDKFKNKKETNLFSLLNMNADFVQYLVNKKHMPREKEELLALYLLRYSSLESLMLFEKCYHNVVMKSIQPQIEREMTENHDIFDLHHDFSNSLQRFLKSLDQEKLTKLDVNEEYYQTNLASANTDHDEYVTNCMKEPILFWLCNPAGNEGISQFTTLLLRYTTNPTAINLLTTLFVYQAHLKEVTAKFSANDAVYIDQFFHEQLRKLAETFYNIENEDNDCVNLAIDAAKLELKNKDDASPLSLDTYFLMYKMIPLLIHKTRIIHENGCATDAPSATKIDLMKRILTTCFSYQQLLEFQKHYQEVKRMTASTSTASPRLFQSIKRTDSNDSDSSKKEKPCN